jgi:hypothetical protein
MAEKISMQCPLGKSSRGWRSFEQSIETFRDAAILIVSTWSRVAVCITEMRI